MEHKTEKITAAEALIRCLELEGVEYIFGIPGSHLLPLFNALNGSKQITHILTKHEEGAAFMALNYTKVSGTIAACVGTVGPGATNLITGVAEAYRACIPLLVLTTQVPLFSFGKNAFQEATAEIASVDQIALLKHVTKTSVLVVQAAQIVPKLREAFRVALSGRRGPVHVCVPTNLFEELVDFEALVPQQYRLADHHVYSIDALERIVELLAHARRAAIIIGARAVFPNCSREIRGLMDRVRIPATTTLAAKGMVDEDHPLSLGCLDMFGHRVAEKYLKRCDLVISLGEDFGEFSTIYWDRDIIPHDSLVQIDCDPYEIGRNYPVKMAVVGEIKAIIRGLYAMAVKRGITMATDGVEIRDLKKELRYFREEEMFMLRTPLKPQRVFSALRIFLPPHVKLFVDVGAHSWWAARYFMTTANAFYFGYGHMSMGNAVAGAIGAQLASPHTPVVCICGDGGFQMNGMEVMTAVNYKLPVVWIIFTDNRLNLIDMTQKLSYGSLGSFCAMKNPDFLKLAEAFGAHAYHIEKMEDFETVFPRLFNDDTPAVVTINYDSQELLPIKPRSVLLMKEMGLLGEMKDSPIAGKAFAKILKER